MTRAKYIYAGKGLFITLSDGNFERSWKMKVRKFRIRDKRYKRKCDISKSDIRNFLHK